MSLVVVRGFSVLIVLVRTVCGPPMDGDGSYGSLDLRVSRQPHVIVEGGGAPGRPPSAPPPPAVGVVVSAAPAPPEEVHHEPAQGFDAVVDVRHHGVVAAAVGSEPR